MHLTQLIRIGDIKPSHLSFGLGNNSFETLSQDPGIVHRDVTDAVKEIVAHGEHTAALGVLGFLGHQRSRPLIAGLPVPVGEQLAKRLLLVLRDQEHVTSPLLQPVKLRFKPLTGELGENGRRARLRTLVADDQFIILDKDRHLGQDLLQRLCPADVNRFGLGLFVRVGDELGPFHTNFRSNRHEPLLDALHAWSWARQGRNINR